jgi:hypothetical protein
MVGFGSRGYHWHIGRFLIGLSRLPFKALFTLPVTQIGRFSQV